VFISSIYIHELTHKYDFKDIDKTNEKMCVLINCEYNNKVYFGYYIFESDDITVQRISIYTENNAMFAQLMYTIFMLALFLLFWIYKLINQKLVIKK
jgi:hypothetical protein